MPTWMYILLTYWLNLVSGATQPEIGGWKALSNGDLVAFAASVGFDCLLTRDTLFGESASRALKLFPRFAVVVVSLPQQRWQQYRDRFLAAWAASPIQPIPGRLVHWPSL